MRESEKATLIGSLVQQQEIYGNPRESWSFQCSHEPPLERLSKVFRLTGLCNLKWNKTKIVNWRLISSLHSSFIGIKCTFADFETLELCSKTKRGEGAIRVMKLCNTHFSSHCAFKSHNHLSLKFMSKRKQTNCVAAQFRVRLLLPHKS